jgi:phage terminase large subunit-like protein
VVLTETRLSMSKSEKQQMLSPAQLLASLPEDQRQLALSQLDETTRAELKYHWPFWARPDQLAPSGDWITWLILAGRGWGKTRTGAETIRSWACGPTPLTSGQCKHIAIVAETSADARDVLVEGPAGLLAIHPKDYRPLYQPSMRRLTWPNGATATLYNAVEPDQLRGPQHDAAWGDEVAKWRYMNDTWDQLQFGLRLGTHPRQILTTTPRPLPLIRKLMNDPTVFTTRGRTYDNAANLAGSFLHQIEERYSGTRLGRQELEGEVLDDIPGALWNRDLIDRTRRSKPPQTLERIIVAVDPATTSEEGSDETGIVCVGLARDADGVARGYVLADRSVRGTPDVWSKVAVNLYREYEADRIVAEKNQGGEMVEAVLRAVDRNVPVKLVTATRGKVVRAEPISALYEQGRVHHVGRFDELEDQMCLFSQDYDRANGSPDRVDALVWGLASLFEKLTGRHRPNKENKESGLMPHPGYKNATNVYQGKSDTSWMA